MKPQTYDDLTRQNFRVTAASFTILMVVQWGGGFFLFASGWTLWYGLAAILTAGGVAFTALFAIQGVYDRVHRRSLERISRRNRERP